MVLCVDYVWYCELITCGTVVLTCEFICPLLEALTSNTLFLHPRLVFMDRASQLFWLLRLERRELGDLLGALFV